jgi:hypothetical protein
MRVRTLAGLTAAEISVAPPLQSVRFREEDDGVLRFHHPRYWTARLRQVRQGAPRAEVDLVAWCRHWRYFLSGALRIIAASCLPRVNALMLHGAALVEPRGKYAVAFVGASESGKSSMLERLPGWRALADDTVIVALPPGNRGWTVMGSPFLGAQGFPTDGRAVPLARLVFLSPRSPELDLEPLNVESSYHELLGQLMWYVADGPMTGFALDLLLDLARSVRGDRLMSSLCHDVAPVLGAREA